jgi:hypothetical protein
MNPGDKIPKRLASEPIEKARSGREAWRGLRIIAESAAATETAGRRAVRGKQELVCASALYACWLRAQCSHSMKQAQLKL